MILPFNTQINGKPTYFVERIHKGFRLMELIMKAGIDPNIHYPPNYNYIAKDKKPHKITSFREDIHDRWQPGTKIDFFINCRQKDMFRFAPVLPVVSTQKVEIKWFELFGNKMVRVFIDDKSFAKVVFGSTLVFNGDMLQLAQNDGFDTIEDFFAYFNEDFKGKIIHWTDLRY